MTNAATPGPQPDPSDGTPTQAPREDATRSASRVSPLLGGAALIIGGVALLADRLGVVDIDVGGVISQGWPVVIVLWGVGTLAERHWTEGGAITVIGLLLLGSTTGVGPDVGVGVLVAVALVAVGIATLGEALRRKPSS